MAPVLHAMTAHYEIESLLCVTAQHREMLDQVLEIFDLKPDFDLNIMQPGQSLSDVTARILLGLEPIIAEVKPDWILVHGDTTTTAAASIAAYYQSIPLAHVEAGLRTHNIYAPWPEEINRKIAGNIAKAHFAPTESAKSNLLAESVVNDNIIVTGNTVVDALLYALEQLKFSEDLRHSTDRQLPKLDSSRKLIVVTGHRRESFGVRFENICQALMEISHRDDVQIVYPVHLNPYVKGVVEDKLSGCENIHLIAPLGYLSFVRLMSKAHIIITDSGGIQEEAPSLGIPVLVTRQTTERPEALESGTVRLVGQDVLEIVSQATALLDDPKTYKGMSEAQNPYGDGKAAERIVSHLLEGMQSRYSH